MVESHDYIAGGITDLLINRCYKTHVIKTFIDSAIRLNNDQILYLANEDDYKEITDEYTAEGIKFIYLKSLS